jgi:hypothetical protein
MPDRKIVPVSWRYLASREKVSLMAMLSSEARVSVTGAVSVV